MSTTTPTPATELATIRPVGGDRHAHHQVAVGGRRSTGLTMTGETATRNSAASMTLPSWQGGC
jgi:hypothetical protein